MINCTDLKNGTTFLLNGKPHKVVKYSHSKVARGGATVRITAKNLETGSIENKSYNSSAKVEDITTLKKRLQFLYSDGSNATFMDPKTYDQTEIPVLLIKEELTFIKEGDGVDVLFWEENALAIDISPKVKMEVVDCAPGIKGNSASNMYKSAKLENGLTLKVPLFIEKGDEIRVDTRTSEYIERVKN